MPDLESMATSVAAALRERQHTVSVSESSGGGLISACLVAIPGASDYYVGGVVSYTRAAQKGFMHVPRRSDAGPPRQHRGLRPAKCPRSARRSGHHLGLERDRASGPTGNRYGDSAGHACIAVSGPVEKSITIETGDDNREANMWVFARHALDLLEQCIREAP